MQKNEYIGRVVFSKAGRDKGKKMLIIDVVNDEYVYLTDGSLRRVEKPKKKKLKHLVITDLISEEIKDDLLSEKKVSNTKIRKFLQLVDDIKEV